MDDLKTHENLIRFYQDRCLTDIILSDDDSLDRDMLNLEVSISRFITLQMEYLGIEPDKADILKYTKLIKSELI